MIDPQRLGEDIRKLMLSENTLHLDILLLSMISDEVMSDVNVLVLVCWTGFLARLKVLVLTQRMGASGTPGQDPSVGSPPTAHVHNS